MKKDVGSQDIREDLLKVSHLIHRNPKELRLALERLKTKYSSIFLFQLFFRNIFTEIILGICGGNIRFIFVVNLFQLPR